MAPERVRFLSAVLVTSTNPDRLAEFYRDILGLPLVREEHGGAAHWGCELGDIHFAVHPARATQPEPVPGAVRVALMVFDLPAYVRALADRGVAVLYSPVQLGQGSIITAIRDPDGNEVELTQMGDDWMQRLERHRAVGEDVLLARRSPDR
jgi:predicted enzyme related to lactoylglutathione lyase